MDLRFYHLTTTTLESSLSVLLRKTIDQECWAFVRFGTLERARWFDDYLWTFDDKYFLPHGLSCNQHATEQPILLTAEQTAERANNASYVFWVDGFWPNSVNFSLETSAEQPSPCWPLDLDANRLSIVFSGEEEQQLEKARQLYKLAKQSGTTELSYWKQADNGTWQRASL